MEISKTMKKIALLLAACAAVLCVSCKKAEDPNRIQFSIEGDGSLSLIELAESVNAQLVVSAPRKINALYLSMGLGGVNFVANQHIGIEANKGTDKQNAVFDLIKDAKVVAYLRGLGIEAGESLTGRETVTIDVKKIILDLIKEQLVENNRTFSVIANVEDLEGVAANANLTFHYTSAPTIIWPGNTNFDTVTLDLNDPLTVTQFLKNSKIYISAPGKINALTVTLEDGADPALVRWITNRISGTKPVIDLVGDPKASSNFKEWFPTMVKGYQEVALDFKFMSTVAPDLKTSTNTFTLRITDALDKKAEATARFRIVEQATM